MLLSRVLVAASLLASAVTAAQNLTLSDVPSCPLSCVIEAVTASTCSISDTHCLCTNNQIYHATATCVRQNCSVVDSLKLAKYQAQVCDRPVESQQGTVRGWLIAQLAAVFLTTGLRLYSCWRVKGGFYAEDYLIVLVCCICGYMSSLLFLMVGKGFGEHIYQIESDSAIAEIYFYFWMDELSYTVIINLIKISLLCLFLRVFPNHKFRIASITMIVFLIGVAIMWAMLLTFQCQPVSTNWNINIPHSKCHNVQIYAYIGAASSMCEDIIIMVLPVRFLLQLKVSTRKKIGVLLIFSLGIFVVIISAVRIRSIYLFGISGDPTWDNVDLTIWTAFEIAVAVICCNLPSIAGLVTYYRRIYFPGNVSEPNDSMKPLKWTGTTATSGLASPRFPPSPRLPPSPRFPPEKRINGGYLISIDEDMYTAEHADWVRTSTTTHSSQSTSIRENEAWKVEAALPPPRDSSMSPVQRLRASFRTSKAPAAWPFPEHTIEQVPPSPRSITSRPSPFRTSSTGSTIHPATQTPTILPSPQTSPNPSPSSPTSLEEGQPWPLPLRPPPFHARRQNLDVKSTNIKTKRAYPLPSPIIISPQPGVDLELDSLRKDASLRSGMI